MYRGKVATAVLSMMLPAVATAQVTLNVIADTDPSAAVAPITELDDPAFTTGSQLTLWTVVNTEIPLDGLEYRLHVNGDADNDKFDLVAYATGPLSGLEGALGLSPPRFDGLGQAFSLAGPPLGFGFLDYDKKVDGLGLPDELRLDSIPATEAIFNGSGLVQNLNGKTVVGYIIEANELFTAGVYEFSAIGPIGASANAEWTSTPQAGFITQGGSFTLTVIPEPTSALLLLAAVPFLRRRRA